MPPSENITFIKATDGAFYRASTSSVYYDVPAIKSRITELRTEIEHLVAILKSAAAVGVTDAETLVTTLKAEPLTTVDKEQPLLVNEEIIP